MAQYIQKDSLVAEIEKLKERYRQYPTRNTYEDGLKDGRMIGYVDALYKINTLKVPEVDLEKEIQRQYNVHKNPDNSIVKDCVIMTEDGFEYFAKHFFELGLKAHQENNVIGTIEREVKIDAGGYPYIDCDIEFYDYDKDIPLAKEGDKVKVVIVKEE